MMKKLIALMAALAVGSAAPAAAKPYDYDKSAVVRITCEAEGTMGTAFHVGNGLYVTATHVVQGCEDKFRYTADGDFATYKGEVIPAVLRYSCKDYKAGDEYVATGYGLGAYTAFSIPWLASKIVIKDGYRAFYGDGLPGMSGGPVIDDDGAARGIVNERWPAHSMSFKNSELC